MFISLFIYPSITPSPFKVAGVNRRGSVILKDAHDTTFFVTQKVFNAICANSETPCIMKKVGNTNFIGTFLTY